MPVYDYKCGSCDYCFECRQTFDSEPFAVCPHCGAVAHRQLHCVPVIFKGSGFYITDNREGLSDSGESAKAKGEGKKEEKEEKEEKEGTSSRKD